MNTTFRESKVRNYVVKAVDVYVTEYNDAYDDWSGTSFAKAPFILGHLTLDGEITKEDIARLILKELFVFNYDTSLDDVMDSMEILDGTFRISINEDEDGFADDLGRYLASYTISVDEIIEVDLENIKEWS